MHFRRQLKCWSLRCSWSIAYRRRSNYIFILDLTPGFNILRKDNCKPRQETFNFWDLVHLILEILRYIKLFPGYPMTKHSSMTLSREWWIISQSLLFSNAWESCVVKYGRFCHWSNTNHFVSYKIISHWQIIMQRLSYDLGPEITNTISDW